MITRLNTAHGSTTYDLLRKLHLILDGILFVLSAQHRWIERFFEYRFSCDIGFLPCIGTSSF